ncbi:hypothetical protein HN709_01035, partial [Candidatus Peregrinibacteria bacterium]|nr:hypothetical protein [Candidatus Peregrinibacteria bacterium]
MPRSHQNLNNLIQSLSGLFQKHLSREELSEIEILGIKTGAFHIIEKQLDLEMTLFEITEFLEKRGTHTQEIIEELK